MVSYYYFMQARTARRLRLEINVSDLAKMLETTANVAYVKNLSAVWRSNQSFLTRSVRGSQFLNL